MQSRRRIIRNPSRRSPLQFYKNFLLRKDMVIDSDISQDPRYLGPLTRVACFGEHCFALNSSEESRTLMAFFAKQGAHGILFQVPTGLLRESDAYVFPSSQ